MLYSANRTMFKPSRWSVANRLRLSMAGKPRLSRREQMLLRLRHPNIAPMYLDRWRNEFRVATEPMPGPTLADQIHWRQTIPFGVAEVLELLSPTANALEYAHKQGVVHGNLHPGAIVQMPDGPVLNGFNGTDAHHARMYRAPEAIERQATPSSDVYALALISYQMLTGTLPGSARPALRRLPRGIDQVLARALASDPRQRYASPARFLHALETLPEHTSYFAACRAKVRRQRQNLMIAMFSFVVTMLIAAVVLGSLVATQL